MERLDHVVYQCKSLRIWGVFFCRQLVAPGKIFKFSYTSVVCEPLLVTTMMSTMLRLTAILAVATTILASPAPRGLETRQSCSGQSCTIAALSGSSGQPYNPTTTPEGGSDSGDCCIIRYNPSAANVLYQEKPELKALCATLNGRKRDALTVEEVTNVKRQACAPNTLIFARGTSELGTLGTTVGPLVAGGLEAIAPGQWSIQGVPYDASIAGDDCLGLPGGQIAAQLLASVASKCPKTKIVMSGYSEGAMVVRDVSRRSSVLHSKLTKTGRGVCYSCR